MKIKNTIAVLVFSLIFTGMGVGATKSKHKSGIVLSASDGNKTISLLWFAPVSIWPEGGWRLLDQNGKVLVKRIIPENPSQELTNAIETARAGGKGDRDMLNGLLAFHVLGSFEQAKALGLAWTLSDVMPGKKIYKIQGLTSDGKPGKLVLKSDPIDSSKTTALPPAPGNLKAVPALSGAQLFWSPVKDNLDIPVMSYKVERVSVNKALAVKPLLIKGMSWDPDLPAYTDTLAPVEKMLTYQVYSIDALGRQSRPSKVTFFMSDMAAMAPPIHIEVTAAKNQVVLKWQHDKTPNTSGFIVERSPRRDGIYDPLTPKALKPSARSFKDKTVIQGLGYYYRIRAMGTKGDPGTPSEPIKVYVPSGTVPQPRKLDAKINPILVTLTWERPDFPVAGYIIERRAKVSKQWDRLNSGLIVVRSYKDRFPFDSFGTFYYRVTAASHDHRLSRPSKEIKVIKPDMTPPGTPRITSISGRDGNVTLTFEPGHPKVKTHTYKIIRDIPSRKGGNIIIKDLSSKKTKYVDTDVIPGQAYWYAMVGIDKTGKESPWSRKHLVTVISPEIPTPQKPRAKFSNEPFAHVKLQFRPPPDTFKVAVQRQKEDNGIWRTLLEGISGTDFAVDTNPEDSGISMYRIVYQSADGSFGEPSDSIKIERK